jgi:tRNA threonylcarbamoyladenosine biosynthesis protein TsaB
VSTFLIIDTASAEFALALAVDGAVVRESARDAGQDHSRLLLVAIDDLLGSDAPALDAVVVIRGPGSYAGVRVGLATAAGIAMARGLPVIGVGTLEAVAAVAGRGEWLVIHPAGRGTFAVQPARSGHLTGPMLPASGEELSGTRLAGEDAGSRGGLEVRSADRCRAAARLALDRPSEASATPPEALYLREPGITVSRKKAV